MPDLTQLWENKGVAVDVNVWNRRFKIPLVTVPSDDVAYLFGHSALCDPHVRFLIVHESDALLR